jgi:hypothetical protein
LGAGSPENDFEDEAGLPGPEADRKTGAKRPSALFFGGVFTVTPVTVLKSFTALGATV